MARSDYSFFFPFRVRYAEVDGQMIVFNAHYLTYFDTAITEFFRVLPYDYQGQVERTGEDYHTVKTLVECRVGGGARWGWPPSAAQTARTVFP